jgi:hypothetical protein
MTYFGLNLYMTIDAMGAVQLSLRAPTSGWMDGWMDGWIDQLIDSVAQARYKEDPQKQNEMIAQLYKDEEVNPLAGCIPTLIQLPIFISLYRGLLELAQADKLQESFLWIPSLEGPVGEYNPVTNLPVDSLGWLTKNWVDGCVAEPPSACP